jgi:hypothetical protein
MRWTGCFCGGYSAKTVACYEMEAAQGKSTNNTAQASTTGHIGKEVFHAVGFKTGKQEAAILRSESAPQEDNVAGDPKFDTAVDAAASFRNFLCPLRSALKLAGREPSPRCRTCCLPLAGPGAITADTAVFNVNAGDPLPFTCDRAADRLQGARITGWNSRRTFRIWGSSAHPQLPEGLQPSICFATFTLRVRRCGFVPRMELAVTTESIRCRNGEGGTFTAPSFHCQ